MFAVPEETTYRPLADNFRAKSDRRSSKFQVQSSKRQAVSSKLSLELLAEAQVRRAKFFGQLRGE
jgi:hypothetical protein